MEYEQLEFSIEGAVSERSEPRADTVRPMTSGQTNDADSGSGPVDGLDDIEQDARRRLEDAKAQIAIFTAQAKKFADIAEVTRKAREARTAERFGIVAFELAALQKRLADVGQAFPPLLSDALNEARLITSGKRDAIVDGVLAGASVAGFSLQAGTRFPSFALDSGFYTLEFDADKFVVTLRTRDGRKSGTILPWDVDEVVGSLVTQRERCFPAKANTKALANTVNRLAKKAPEGRVPIDDVFAELQKAKVVAARDEFAVLLREGSLAGVVALEHARNPSDGLLLPGLETQGRFGYVGVASAK